MHRIVIATCAVALGGCLGAPELKTCAEFEIGTEGCGSGCDVYCDLMVESCSSVYENRARCMNDCANEPVTNFVIGELGDTEGNSLSCRITQALEDNCDDASLATTAICVGASCDDYCALMMANCEGAYPSLDYCKSTCASLPRGASDADANTVECRFKYAQQTEANPGTACNPASLNGGGVCGDACDPYCSLLERNCTGDNALYASPAECKAVCALMNPGNFDDWDFAKEIDSIECRTYHAGPPAELEPGVHCVHAGVYNAMHCGIDPTVQPQPDDWPCPVYCDLLNRHCPGSITGLPTCLTTCAMMDEVQNADPAKGPALYPVSTMECPQ